MLESLTLEETSAWLRSSGTALSSDIPEDFPGVRKAEMRNLMVGLPSNPRQIAYFSMRIVEWLHTESVRLLWVWKWHQYPLVQKTLFETVRRGRGVEAALSLSPGHLFQPNRDADFEIEYSSEEHAILSGLLLLMMLFDWQGFVAAEGRQDQIIIGDESILFCSTDPTKLAEAVDLAKEYNAPYLFDRKA